MQHPEHEFHVVENEIVIDFAVPLPAGGADEVLTELLSHHSLEIIRDRKERGQPLDNIPVARLSAQRLGEPVEIAVLDLGQPGEFLEKEIPDMLPRPLVAGYDPLARFGEKEDTKVIPLRERRGDELAPIAQDVTLTAGLAAGLRSLGVDPEAMTATQLGVGLLRLSGYEVSERKDGTYLAIGHGTTTLVKIVDHQAGEYPELAEAAVTSFLIAFASARTERGLLLTDKYGPYMIYQKERANPDAMFIVRERLQDFIDAVAVA